MLLDESKINFVNSSINNLVRIITPTTLAEIGSTPSQDNQSAFLNNIQKSHTNVNIRQSKKDKRIDKNGNIICKNGKHRVTFIDKISKNKFVDIIKVESFKEYNKMEEITSNYINHNGCCLLQ